MRYKVNIDNTVIPILYESRRSVVEAPTRESAIMDAERYADIVRKRALRKDAPSFQIGVRCSGSVHRVIWTERGRVKIPDHSKEDLKALKTLRSLGDESCTCLAMLARFKRGGVETEPFLRSKQGWKAPRESAIEARRQRRGRAQITDPLWTVNGRRFRPLAVAVHSPQLETDGARILATVLAGVAPNASISVAHGRVAELAIVQPFRWDYYQKKVARERHVAQAVLPISWLRLNSLNLGRVAVAWPGKDGATKTGNAFGLKLLREEPEGWLVHVAVVRRVEGVVLFAFRNAFFRRDDVVEAGGVHVRVGRFTKIQPPVNLPEPSMADVAIEELA